MATIKPRITITLEPHAYEVIRRLAKANGRSMSAVVTEFLDLASPQMERLVSILESALGAPQEAHTDIRRSLERAESALLPTIRHALRQRDLLLDLEGVDVDQEHLDDRARETATAGAKRQAGQPRGQGQPPVPVTRGVGTPKPRRKAQTKSVRHG